MRTKENANSNSSGEKCATTREGMAADPPWTTAALLPPGSGAATQTLGQHCYIWLSVSQLLWFMVLYKILICV